MAKTLAVATLGAIASRSACVPRNFIWVLAKNRATGVVEGRGFWDEPETVSTTVISGVDGSEVVRAFQGGAIDKLDAIPLVVGLADRTIQVTLAANHAAVDDLVRTLDPRFASVEIYRGHYDPATMLLVAVPTPRFLGKVNGTPIRTAAAGGEGTVTLSIVSHTRELSRTNPAKKSDEAQRRRSGDRFRRYNSVVSEIPVWWGEANEAPAAVAAAPKGLFGLGGFLGIF